METGDRIRATRIERGLTQKQLGDLCGMADSAIRRYESGRGNPTEKTLQRIASALSVPAAELLTGEKGTRDNPFWTVNLNDKLKCVGCSLEFAEVHEEYIEWLEFPDGTLEVTDAELRELDQSTDSYLRFKLQELRERHPDDFRPKRKRPQGPQQAPESTTAPQESKDTTPPTDAPGTPPKGK